MAVAPRDVGIIRKETEPVWIFEEEKLAAEIQRQQEEFAIRQKIKDRVRKKEEAAEKLRVHNKIMAMNGPAWFQQLSGAQEKAAEGLYEALKIDLHDCCTYRTVYQLTQLGLLPLPTIREVWGSILASEGGDAVEFLVALYSKVSKEPAIKREPVSSPYLEPHLFKPEPPKHSGKYSGERDVHPRSHYFSYVEALKKEGVWPKKSEYKYKNKSPLPELVLRNDKLRSDAGGDAPSAGKRAEEVAADRVTAQAQKGLKAKRSRGDRAESIEGLASWKDTDIRAAVEEYAWEPDISLHVTSEADLLAPDMVRILGGVTRTRTGEMIYYVCGVTTLRQNPPRDDRCTCLRIFDRYDEKAQVDKFKEQLEEKQTLCVIGGLKMMRGDEPPVPIITGLFSLADRVTKKEEPPKVPEKKKRMVCEQIMGGVKILPDNTKVNIITGLADTTLRDRLYEKIVGGIKILPDKTKVRIITGIADVSDTGITPETSVQCTKCLEYYTRYLQRLSRAERTTFIIGGVAGTDPDSKKPVYIVNGVRNVKVGAEIPVPCGAGTLFVGGDDAKRMYSDYMQGVRSSVSDVAKGSGTYIIGGVTKAPDGRDVLIITGTAVTSNRSSKYKLRPGKTYMISGMGQGPDGQTVPIISGVVDEKAVCGFGVVDQVGAVTAPVVLVEDRRGPQCLEACCYTHVDPGAGGKSLLVATDGNKIQDAFVPDCKFIIGGIKVMPDGTKQFIIGGVVVDNGEGASGRSKGMKLYKKYGHDTCIELYKKYRKQHPPQPPDPKYCYMMGGVRESPSGSPGGPTFIVTGVAARHITDTTKGFDVVTEDGTERLSVTSVTELNKSKKRRKPRGAVVIIGGVKPMPDGTNVFIISGVMQKEGPGQILPVIGGVKILPDGSTIHIITGLFQSRLPREDEEPCECLEMYERYEAEIIDYADRADIPEIEFVTFKSGLLVDYEFPTPKETQLMVIPEKIKPIATSHADQMKQVKGLLAELAIDGYPLACIPQCHKLPHFKVWMMFRSKQYWTPKQKHHLIRKSVDHWNHLKICDFNVHKPKLNTILEKYDHNDITWKYIGHFRHVLGKAAEDSTRKIRQELVRVTREIWPTTYPYIYVNDNFKDVFFSYCPASEPNCQAIAVRPWQSHEFKKGSR